MKRKIALLFTAGMIAASLAACGSTSGGAGADTPANEDAGATSANENAASGNDTSANEDTASGNDTSANEDTSAGDDASGSDLAYVKDKGTLVVGITDFEPMDYKDDNGEWIGFDADLAKAFGESIGVNVEFVEIEWDNKVMELDAKSIDCVWNGMTLTDEVTGSMDCTNPYCENAQVVIVPTDVADQYQNEDSLADLAFAVETGSAGEKQAVERGLNYTPVQSQANTLLEVSSGTSDAAIIDSLMAAAMVGEGTSYADLTYTVKLNAEEYGVGFRKGSDLKDELNKFFSDSYKDGKMTELAEQYGVQAAIIEQQ